MSCQFLKIEILHIKKRHVKYFRSQDRGVENMYKEQSLHHTPLLSPPGQEIGLYYTVGMGIAN
jgi:hypothetical protein